MFTARLLVLDEIEGTHASEAFVLSIYRDTQDFWDGPLIAPVGSLARVAVDWWRECNSGVRPHTIPQQFVSDLNMFGLREALGYLVNSFETFDLEMDGELAQRIVEEYQRVGTRFNARSEEVRESLKGTLQKYVERRAQAPGAHVEIDHLVERLVLSDATRLGSWGDGQPQNNLALESDQAQGG